MAKDRARRGMRRKLKAHDRGDDRHNKGVAQNNKAARKQAEWARSHNRKKKR